MSSSGNFIIYGLSDPRFPNTARYIGCTSLTLDRRLQLHITRITNDPRGRWIKKLRANGLIPQIWPLEVCVSPAEADQREMYWIQKLRGSNRLLNVYDGGKGATGKRNTTEANRLRALNQSRKRPIWCPETGEKFESIKLAARKIGCWENTIRDALRRGDVVGSRTPGAIRRTFEYL